MSELSGPSYEENGQNRELGNRLGHLYSWPLNNVGVQGTKPVQRAVENLSVILDSTKLTTALRF